MMGPGFDDRAAQERRARLAAERLSALRATEAQKRHQALEHQSRALVQEVAHRRADLTRLGQSHEALAGEAARARAELARASAQAARTEDRLWQSLQSMRDGYALFDAEDRLVLANAAFLSIFDGLGCVAPGTSYADLVDTLLDEGIVDPGMSAGAWRALMLARRREDPIPDQVMRLWNGQIVKLSDRRTPEGDVVMLGINQTDLSRMWAAVETVPDGFLLTDAEDRIVAANPPWLALHPGCGAALAAGESFEGFLRVAVERGLYLLERPEEWLEARLMPPPSGGRRSELACTGGRWLRLVESPTPDRGRALLMIDVTAMKTHEAALEAERERAEAATRAKSAFLANMSHEIRTPMNGVVGMASLLLDGALSDEQRLQALTIRSSGEALLRILNDILDFSRIEAGRLALRREPFDLELTLHEVMRLLEPQAAEKGLELVADCDMFMPTAFLGDAGRLRQVLTNLIGNAIKFTARGHVLIRVTARETAPGGETDGEAPPAHEVIVSVEDTGIGIPPDKLEHVFGMFNQVDEAQSRQFEGTGLGLSITRQLCRLMGGEVWAESEAGSGATFGFRLPLERAAGTEAPRARLTRGLSGALVIEPPSLAREVLVRQLGRLGLRARCVDAPGDVDAVPEGQAVFVTERALGDDPGEALETLRRAGPAALFLARRGSITTLGQDLPVERFDAVLSSPLRRLTLCQALAALADAGPALPAAPETAAGVRPGLKVLAAEDNRTNRLVLKGLLKGLPIDLELAENGTEAVAAVRRARPDLVLMDISMPGMDGREATRLIRADEAARDLPRLPIVAMTAHAMQGDAEGILAAGLDRYLSKPLSRDALLAELVRVAPGLGDGRDGAVGE